MWEIEATDEFAGWYLGLDPDQDAAVIAAVDELAMSGPALGRPLVDSIRPSRHPHMKELRPRAGNLRILFAFDPRRSAILLLGGDKAGRWQAWYREMVPRADALYVEYLTELQSEGLL